MQLGLGVRGWMKRGEVMVTVGLKNRPVLLTSVKQKSLFSFVGMLLEIPFGMSK